jgi:hypothetical protein
MAGNESFPFETPVRMSVTWGENQRGEGVVAVHPSGMIIFPARNGYAPQAPVATAGGLMRELQPEAGETEMCIVFRPEGRNNGFAFPVENNNLEVVPDRFGMTHQIVVDGGPAVTVIPIFANSVVTARRDDDGDIVITVKRT